MKACHEAKYNLMLLKSKDFRDLNFRGSCTASKNYMQIGFVVILYRFLNQCFGNLAPRIVTFVPARMQNYILISAKVNKWRTYCLLTVKSNA